MASPTDHTVDRDELQARIAAEDQAIKLDEVWSAWAADDLAQRRRAAANDEAEARHIQRLQREELRDLKKKRHWGGLGATARWRLHLDGVPTSLSNGTYGVIGAPPQYENMNLQRTTKWGGGGPLDVHKVSTCRIPLRKPRVVRRRFPSFRNPNWNAGYEWYSKGNVEHDARRAARGVLRHVPSTIFSRPHTTNRFEDSTLLSEDSLGRASSLIAEPVRTGLGHLSPPRHRVTGGSFGRADRWGEKQSVKRDPDRDYMYHPKGPVVHGKDPADLCEATLGAYLGTLARARSGAPS
ncbi:unnamed protein product [Pelagomonas calceolata]|uniref:Uncharacterized protein n=1 Tax=Pelagomonas calceolata TaxID=35677 RepID=A0A8J2SJF2_9STRA|nr:unnamed protein product [Pelagomonas calceolata]|mmetsp:Transcript_23825/g.71300  ORF Transcript_23825/g.71300 Transcript_23825/m.71300 type:complete len:295 (+) Transcript_23825:35-919(+)